MMPNQHTDNSQASITPPLPTPIAVIADNEEHLVPLPNTIHDANLDKSLISRRKAFQTDGRIKPIQPVTFTTAQGHCFASNATITLRWRYDAGLQSYQEAFYVVDSCGDYDAILRRDIEHLDDGVGGGVPKAFPMQFGGHSKKAQEDRKHKDAEKKARDERYQKELEMQKAQLRLQMQGMKVR